jgi:hypothetical protein
MPAAVVDLVSLLMMLYTAMQLTTPWANY